MKYVPDATAKTVNQIVRELRDYLSITNEPTSDWGHDFGFGLAYGYSGDSTAAVDLILDHWKSDQIAISWIR